MSDAKVKQQPFYGTQSHHHHQHHHHHHHLHEKSNSGTTVAMASLVMDAKHAPGALNGSGSPPQSTGKDAPSTTGNTINAGKDKSPASLKYDQLKQRKQELEKRLNEKYSQLQQIKREEAQLIGMYPSDFSCGIGSATENGTGAGGTGGTNGNGTAPTLRRKIGTSFKLPENLLNNKEDDINKLLLEKQIQQQISEASLRLANDSTQPKSVRRTHKQNYEMAQQKLLAINQNLSVLKKRQQQKEQQQQHQLHQQQKQQQQLLQQAQQLPEHKPTARDDIDLHKTAQVNRFRSNSNSSSMLMHLSERRNSVKSNNSSNASGPIAGHHHLFQHQHHQQQQHMLQVQIPGGHYYLQHQQGNQQNPQISPYSIHSGIIPSGSQSMTSAASAAMISQLSMLRHRARTDSFPGIATNYDTTSTGSGTAEQNVKLSPLSGSGSIVSGGSINHHHQQQGTIGHHHLHHHHHQVGPGPARMNRLIQQQIGVNCSPPPAPGGISTTPGYLLSPTAGADGAQAFLYDAKVISRLQGNGSIGGNSNMLHSPPATAPPSGHMVNDQNYCLKSMDSTTPTNSAAGRGYEQGNHEPLTVPSGGGLGGYWMTLENGEKVWCSVDSRQFSSLDRKQQGVQGGSMKLSRTSTKLSDRVKPNGPFPGGTAVKSSSLGNFQEYIGKPSSLDDNEMISIQPDAISVTSGSSEHKKREKVWRETSLDSPVVKHKALPPVPPLGVQGQMSPSSAGSGHLLHSPNAALQSPPYIPPTMSNPSTLPLHINTNVSGYGGPSSPLLLSPQQMRYYQQRQQQLLEQQRQRIKHQQQQQQQEQQHMQQHQQQSMQHQQQRLMLEEQQQQQQQHLSSASSRQREMNPGGSLHPPLSITMNGPTATALSTTTSEPYSSYQYQQQPIPPPYHSRHQHPPPPPLPPMNQHHYHHSQLQQQLQSRLEHPPPAAFPASGPTLKLDLLPHSYSQQFPDRVAAHISPTLSHGRMGGPQDGYYPHQGHLSSRHPDLVISPTLSQSSSHTLTSQSVTAVVQALPVVGGGSQDSGSISPSPSMPAGGTMPSDIHMESPKNMTVVQQGKIMPYKEVTKPFEMSDFYKYSTKYRQKQQQQQMDRQQAQSQQRENCNSEDNEIEPNGSSTGAGSDSIHMGIYQPPNRSICQPLVNNYN